MIKTTLKALKVPCGSVAGTTLRTAKKKAVQVWTTNFMYSTLYRKEVEDIALLYQSPAVVDFERILEFQITRRPNFM